MACGWRTFLITTATRQGPELAIAQSRRRVRYARLRMDTLKMLRPDSAGFAAGPTAASPGVADVLRVIAATQEKFLAAMEFEPAVTDQFRARAVPRC